MDLLIRRFATIGIAVSRSAAPSLFSDSWTSDARWRLCSLGIDLQPFAMAVDSKMLRAELGIARNSFVVGNVARFAKQKNHRFLVDIAEHLSRMEPNVVFMLVGEGPLKPEIEALVRERGLSANFIFLGAREDVPRLLLGAMDCFLLTSLHEGLGLVVWEAQAARLTCVISDLIPEEARLEATLVRRLSLNQPAEVWANELRRLRPLADNVRDAMSSLLFDCTIQASAAALTHIYDSSLCNTHAAGGAVGSRA